MTLRRLQDTHRGPGFQIFCLVGCALRRNSPTTLPPHGCHGRPTRPYPLPYVFKTALAPRWALFTTIARSGAPGAREDKMALLSKACATFSGHSPRSRGLRGFAWPCRRCHHTASRHCSPRRCEPARGGASRAGAPLPPTLTSEARRWRAHPTARPPHPLPYQPKIWNPGL